MSAIISRSAAILEDLITGGRRFFSKNKSEYAGAGLLRKNKLLGLKYARSQMGWEEGLKPTLKWGVPFALLGMASYKKGEFVKETATQTGLIAGGYLGGVVGGALGGIPGALVGNLVGGYLGDIAGKVADPVMETGRLIGHSNFGGNYKDTEKAYTFRQQAVQSMNSSILNARQYLGKESLLFHT